MGKHPEYLDEHFDEEFGKIQDLRYYPWVGKEYRRQKDQYKVLIIAESVYDWDEGSDHSQKLLARKDFARRVVLEHGLGCPPLDRVSPPFRNTERAIYGERDIPQDPKRNNLWISVALHQYVQRPMKRREKRPDQNDYQKGATILKKILKILEPHLCIFWGTEWKKVSPISEYAICSNECYNKINGAWPRIFTLKDKAIKLLMIKHPSQRFSWVEWHSKFLTIEASEYINHMKSLD